MGSGQPLMPTARLNLAENMLLAHPSARSKTKLAVIGLTEPPPDRPREPTFLRQLTFDALYDEVRRAAHALRQLGVKPGTCVGAYIPNCVEALVVMLAVNSLGGVLSMTATEFGVTAVLDRLEQVEPTVLLTSSSYRYNGKVHGVMEKVVPIVDALAQRQLRTVIVVDQLSQSREVPVHALPTGSSAARYMSWGSFLKLGQQAPKEIQWWRGPASAPCYILCASHCRSVR